MKIIKYEDKYRDDMIFMILEAKNTLGRVDGLNEDLLDIIKLIQRFSTQRVENLNRYYHGHIIAFYYK